MPRNSNERRSLVAAEAWLRTSGVRYKVGSRSYKAFWNLYRKAIGDQGSRLPKNVTKNRARTLLVDHFIEGNPRQADPSAVSEINRQIRPKKRVPSAPVARGHTPADPIREVIADALRRGFFGAGRGVDPNSSDFLFSAEWRRLRYDALQLHGARCQCCGASARTGSVINVDHIIPRKTHPHLALTLSNLQVLCGDCNAGKGNRDTTDWRPDRTA